MPSIAYIWILIPLAGILSGVFKDYLKFKATQKELGVSSVKLEGLVVELRSQNEQQARRIENLEAVVTSRLWHSTGASATPADRARLDIALSQLEPEVPSAERRMERLAESLGI
ncbi:MAG: hypothetical protein K8J08_15395 [Thermoanaerobaculia bacterium]|nr:hypothetical protein [Thermoanaerobaculia bacterium]